MIANFLTKVAQGTIFKNTTKTAFDETLQVGLVSNLVKYKTPFDPHLGLKLKRFLRS